MLYEGKNLAKISLSNEKDTPSKDNFWPDTLTPVMVAQLPLTL